MVLDRFVAQPQANADLLVAQALPQQRKNLLFAKAQFANRLLTGNAGANTLSGQGGDDFLIGWAGGDTLNGGAGDDFLDGGAGDDAMNGGAGNDIFAFASGFGPPFDLAD